MGLQSLIHSDALLLATETGDLVELNLATNTTETEAHCTGGIVSITWSPDQEVFAYVTRDGLLCIMDSMYIPVGGCELAESGFGDGAFVNVGWGAKETQFHGTEGKAARHIKPNQGVVLDAAHVDRSVSIAWRGDSELFAVSFVAAADNNRQFKVFDKEANIKFTSEVTVGLEAPFCWRPSGTWIAIPQTLSNKYVVALFEKNGLRHREIVLPFKSTEEPVVRLEFSEDSDVLAIQTRCKATKASSIYLYTICNYHWYLKQTLRFDATVVAFAWDPCFTETKQMSVLTEDGALHMYRWEFAVNATTTFALDDQAVVAVVDGKKVLLTAFRGAVVPPPMCSLEVVCDEPVNWVDFLHFPESPEKANYMLIVDAAHTVSCYAPQFEYGVLKNVQLVNQHKMPVKGVSLKYTHWLWLNEETIITVSTDQSNSQLFYFKFTKDGLIEFVKSTKVTGRVSRLCAISASSLRVATTLGSYHIQLDTFNPAPSIKYPDLVEHICAPNGRDVFALKHRHWLQCGDKVLATDVTSMCATEQYLAFTKLDRLFFVRLADQQIVGERRIERGARLVVIVPKDCRTVLQMPRGNLEVIQPRVLSLCIIGQFLETGDYYKAFDLMRKQRINLNLIVDHNPELFAERSDEFVRSIQANPNWLNLFLTDLEEVDVTVTMYGSNYPGRHSIVVTERSKVASVCDQVVQSIHRLELTDQLILPILTTHVKQKQLEQALLYVWHRRQDDQVAADAALKYLLYLVDVNEMYNVALGTYNFDLVKYVATKSQKDPREYLPFLDSLQQIEDQHYRRYRIDKHLKRYAKAVEHIARCGADRLDEALELVIGESLYRKAMNEYAKAQDAVAGRDECQKQVVHAFAEYLREKGRIREACLMYERGEDLAQALMSARHILDWQKCVALAKAMQQSDEDVEKLVR